MSRTKYPIKKEFFPFNLFSPPMSRAFVSLAQKGMKTPKCIYKNPNLDTQCLNIPGYEGGKIEIFVFSPKGISSPAPCFVNFHGGGFVFEGYQSHFKMAMAYALYAQCKVVYVRYRLAPKFPFPYPQEDCFKAFTWVCEHAQSLGIDPNRVGVGGDSAGGTLSAAVCLMARDRNFSIKPLFQMLVYPWLDGRNESDSNRKFTDTPMWNSTLSKKVGPIINPNPEKTPIAYRSPAEADSHKHLPPAYIEVAEFDCLRDDGILYANLLRNEEIPVEFHETKGTMHGFDTVFNAPTTQKMIKTRAEYLSHAFHQRSI